MRGGTDHRRVRGRGCDAGAARRSGGTRRSRPDGGLGAHRVDGGTRPGHGRGRRPRAALAPHTGGAGQPGRAGPTGVPGVGRPAPAVGDGAVHAAVALVLPARRDQRGAAGDHGCPCARADRGQSRGHGARRGGVRGDAVDRPGRARAGLAVRDRHPAARMDAPTSSTCCAIWRGGARWSCACGWPSTPPPPNGAAATSWTPCCAAPTAAAACCWRPRRRSPTPPRCRTSRPGQPRW